MKNFDAIEIVTGNDGSVTTRTGTGQRWGNIYDLLEPLGLTVVGGRDSRVGVGGFLLGGELSSDPVADPTDI